MNIADSFYIALCMTVLLLGVVYWFWTQTQYLQRKMNLLENIVYELKTMAGPPESVRPGGPPVSVRPGGPHEPSAPPTLRSESHVTSSSDSPAADVPSYPPPPGSELGEDDDLLHEQLHAAVSSSGESSPANPKVEAGANDDLQPGGVGSGLSVDGDSASPFADSQKPRGNVLDGMTLKELRRLAEQRNIAGASTMRKQALIEALRAEVKVPDAKDGTVAKSEAAEVEAESIESPIRLSEPMTLSLQ